MPLPAPPKTGNAVFDNWIEHLWMFLGKRTNTFYPSFDEVDQGVEGQHKSVKSIVDRAGTTKNATIIFRHTDTGNTTTYTFSTDETIPSNIKIIIENGAILDGAGTLIINGPFEAGLYPVFGASITISFGPGAIEKVYPDWWGANTTPGTTDMTAEIQAAIDSLPTTGGLVQLLGSKYAVSEEITVANSSVMIQGLASMGRPWQAGAAEGSYIVLAGDITGAVFKFAQYDSKNTRACGIHNLGFYGASDRSHSVSTGAVHVERSFAFSMYNVSFMYIDGRALYTQLATKSGFDNLNIYACGGTGTPAVDINEHDASEYTQGCTFSNFKIEACYTAPYLSISANSVANKFNNFGFEADADTAATKVKYMDINGDRNQFDNFHFNKNTGSEWRTTIDSDYNNISNWRFGGDAGTSGMLYINGSYNQGNTIKVVANNETQQMVEIDGNNNSIDNLLIYYAGGIKIPATRFGNSVSGFQHTGAPDCISIESLGLENRFIDFLIDGSSCTSTLIDLNGGENIVHGGIVRDCTSATTGINIAGDRNLLTDIIFRQISSATAINIQIGSSYNIVDSCIFSGVSDTVVDTNNLSRITDTNHGLEEIVTGTVTLKVFGLSRLDASGGAVAATLPDGGHRGQTKYVGMKNASNDSTLSVTHHETSDPEVFTFSSKEDWLVLMWDGTDWGTIKNRGVAT